MGKPYDAPYYAPFLTQKVVRSPPQFMLMLPTTSPSQLPFRERPSSRRLLPLSLLLPLPPLLLLDTPLPDTLLLPLLESLPSTKFPLAEKSEDWLCIQRHLPDTRKYFLIHHEMFLLSRWVSIQRVQRYRAKLYL